MYKKIAVVSVIIRQFVLPNPFEQLPVPVLVNLSGIEIAITPILLNWIAEPMLHAITFAIVGLYYKRSRDHAAKGSFLYLMFYCIHVALLALLAQFGFSTVAISLVVGGYVFCYIGLEILKNRSTTHFSYL